MTLSTRGSTTRNTPNVLRACSTNDLRALCFLTPRAASLCQQPSKHKHNHARSTRRIRYTPLRHVMQSSFHYYNVGLSSTPLEGVVTTLVSERVDPQDPPTTITNRSTLAALQRSSTFIGTPTYQDNCLPSR
jgi:hypothetical protein